MLWLLLKNKLIMTLNGFFKGDIAKRRRKLFALIGGTVLFYFLFQWTYEIFNIISISNPDGFLIMNNMLVLFFFAFFVFLLVTGITISIHYLFVSSDLPLLMSAPLTGTTIFSYKLIESIFANSSFFFFLGIPVFIAYGIVVHTSWHYYPFMLLTIFIFLTLPIAVSFLIAIFIVRIIPAVRAKEIMAGLLGIVSLAIWVAIQMFRVSQFDAQSSEFNPERVESIKQLTQKTIFESLPSTWAAKSLVAFSSDNVSLILKEFLPLILSTTFIFIICLVLAQGLFKQGLVGSQFEVSIKKKKLISTTPGKALTATPLKVFSSTIGAIFLRDFKLISRDLRQLTNVLILVVMMMVFPLLRGREQISSSSDQYMPFIFIIIFSAIVSGQLTSRLIPLEGKSFWIMKLMPQSWSKMLMGKFFIGFIFSVISVWIAVIVSCVHFQTPVRIVALAFTLTFFFSFGIAAFGLVIGSLFPKFDWEHPKRMLSTGGGIISIYGSILFAGIWISFIALIYTIGLYFKYPIYFLDGVVVMLSLIIAGITFIIALNISSKKLSKFEWNL